MAISFQKPFANNTSTNCMQLSPICLLVLMVVVPVLSFAVSRFVETFRTHLVKKRKKVTKIICWQLSLYYISASKATYSAFRLCIIFQFVCSLGIEPTTFALLTQCSNH